MFTAECGFKILYVVIPDIESKLIPIREKKLDLGLILILKFKKKIERYIAIHHE